MILGRSQKAVFGGLGGGERGKVYRFWGGQRKVEYMKTSLQSDDFLFCELSGLSCDRNQEWIKHYF